MVIGGAMLCSNHYLYRHFPCNIVNTHALTHTYRQDSEHTPRTEHEVVRAGQMILVHTTQRFHSTCFVVETLALQSG